MKSLNSFLNPQRKDNIKFVLSDAFVEDGKPIEWEMRQLTASEGMELQSQTTSKNYMEIMAIYVANSLVVPNLKDKELLEGLTKREGRPILKPVEALKVLTTDAELGFLITKYSEHNNLTSNFNDKVKEVKN